MTLANSLPRPSVTNHKRSRIVWGAFCCCALGGLVGLFSGCASAGKLARELGKDDATVSVKVGSIYGNAHVVRSNPKSGQAVIVTPDGTVTITPVFNPFATITAR